MDIKEKVKLALRISTDKLDEEIEANIEAAKSELIRAGVDWGVVEIGGPLVETAIRSFCLSQLANDQKVAERYENSFKYIEDCLRKSGGEVI